MPKRNELIIQVPVVSTDPKEFTFFSANEYHYLVIARVIFEFILAELAPFGIETLFSQVYYFNELIKNAYDSFIARGLIVGESLVLKVVTQEKDGAIVVKLKDNGTGFIGQKKSTYFDIFAVQQTKKSRENGCFGGAGIGLTVFKDELTLFGDDKMLIKNRKEQGASIYMMFQPRNNLEVEEKNETTLTQRY